MLKRDERNDLVFTSHNYKQCTKIENLIAEMFAECETFNEADDLDINLKNIIDDCREEWNTLDNG